MILIVDNYDSFTYNLYHYVLNAGADCVVIEYHCTEEIAQQLANCKAVIISPGPHHPADYPKHRDIIEMAIKFKKPLLGICLGMQSIAYYSGGEICKSDYPMHGKQSNIAIVGQDDIYKNLRKTQLVGRYHSLYVSNNLPDTFLVTAREDRTNLIMSFTHKELSITGIQYHPESILTPYGQMIINNWMEHVHKC